MICLEALDVVPALDALACGHVFHNECLDPLIQAAPSRRIACPFCGFKPAATSFYTSFSLARALLDLNRARVLVTFAEERGLILLVQDWRHRWCLPGGKHEQSDGDESLSDALQATAARELLEETGLQVPRDLYGNLQLAFVAAEGRQAYYIHSSSNFDWQQLRACFQSRSDFREIKDVWVGPWRMAAEWLHHNSARAMIALVASLNGWW